jgi:hypothetical protein
MIAGDNDTGDKFFTGIKDTGEQLSPVTTTLVITFFPGVVDTDHKEPKSLKFIAGVNDTAEKLFMVSTTPMINLLAVSTTPVIRQSCLY